MTDRYASLKQGLVGCWIPSVSGSGLLLPDLSGRGNNGSLVNMDASDWVSGQYGRALDFDGVNDSVICSSTTIGNLGTSNATISLWAKLDNSSRFTNIICKRQNSGVFQQWTVTQGHVNTSGSGVASKKIGIFWYSGGAINDITNNQCFHTVDDFADGNWHHICITRTNGTAPKIYIDGIERALTAIVNGTTNINGDSTEPIYIGSNQVGSQVLGFLDDIRVFNRSLTQTEIRLLASEPGIGFKRNSSAFPARYTYQPPKAKVFEGVRVRDHDYSSLRQGLVGAWCPSLANGGSGNTLPDVSGYNNHGSLVGMGPEDWVSGQYGRALDFDGVDDYVTSAAYYDAGSLSFSFWAYFSGMPANYPMVLQWRRPSQANATQSMQVLFRPTGDVFGGSTPDSASGNRISFAINGATTATTHPFFAMTANTWQHWAGTYDGLNLRLFNSGVLRMTVAGSFANTAGAWNVDIANNRVSPSDGYFKGQLDDVRLYNRALSEPEIRLLASRRGIGLQPSPTRFIAREKKTGLRRKILTGQT